MSNISNFNSSSSRKRQLSQIDDNIEYLTQEVDTLNDFVFKSEFERSLMAVKMKREKVKALSAIAKSQELISNMEVLIAESDLFTDLERLRNSNYKRTKLNRNKDKSRVTPAVTKTSVSVQTIKSMFNKKNKTRHSSSRKSPVDISSDKTVIIPTIHESSASLVGKSQTSPTSVSQGLFNKMPANKSGCEVLLSSSFKAELNELYTKTLTQETIKESQTKKQKSEKKVESKSMSKHVSKRTQSPTASPKMVADLGKSVDTASNNMASSSCAVSTQNSITSEQNSTACATYVPLGNNMGVLLTQPSTVTMHPFLHVNPPTQANMQYHSQKADKSDFIFYCSKQ